MVNEISDGEPMDFTDDDDILLLFNAWPLLDLDVLESKEPPRLCNSGDCCKVWTTESSKSCSTGAKHFLGVRTRARGDLEDLVLSNSAGWIVAGIAKPASLDKQEKLKNDYLKQRTHTNMKCYKNTVYQPEHYIQKKIPYMGTKTSNTVNSSLLLWASWIRSSGILLKQTLLRNFDDHDKSSSIVSV